MSESLTIHSNSSYRAHYRQGRRRWVPKGVLLLAVLFVVGLASASDKKPDSLQSAIAVPSASQEASDAATSCKGESGESLYNAWHIQYAAAADASAVYYRPVNRYQF